MTVAINTDGLACMGCAGRDLVPVLNLGVLPLANALLEPERLGQPEEAFPLEVVMCPACALVQLTVSVPPEKMFSDYAYLSSYAPSVFAWPPSYHSRNGPCRTPASYVTSRASPPPSYQKRQIRVRWPS